MLKHMSSEHKEHHLQEFVLKEFQQQESNATLTPNLQGTRGI